MTTKLCKFAHELNNSLTVISGHAELLSTECSQDELIAAHVTAIQQAVRHAAEVIDRCQCALGYAEHINATRERARTAHSSLAETPSAGSSPPDRSQLKNFS